MSRRSRTHFLHGKCRRCDRPLVTASRSLLGADALKAQWELICAQCLTPEETQEIEDQLSAAAQRLFFKESQAVTAPTKQQIQAALASEYPVVAFIAAGWTPSALIAAGCTPSDLGAAGWTPSDLRAAGWTPSDLRAGGWTPSNLIAAGWTPSDLRAAGWTPSDLRAAGWTPSEIEEANCEWESIPLIPRLYSRLLADIESHRRLFDQSTFGPWRLPENVCETPMCTAGHLVHLAGDAGCRLRDRYGWPAAARLIHLKNRPDAPPQNYGAISDELALAYIRERAREEAEMTSKEGGES